MTEEEIKRLTEDLKKIAENLSKLIDMANIKMREINRLMQGSGQGNLTTIPGNAPPKEEKSSPQSTQFGKTRPSFMNQANQPEEPPDTQEKTDVEEKEAPRPAAQLRDISSGVEKLDELLMGGVRTASNALLLGPPYSSKYTLAWNFVANSIKENIPVIVITTDKDIREITYEINNIYDKVEEAEEEGLLIFIDVYSRSIGSQSPSKHAVVIDNLINVSSLLKAVDSAAAKIREKYPYYRLLFSSLTSYVNELDEKVLMKFVQQFVQKRKSENCVSFNILESGLFEKKLIEAISYLMDGSITFRTEGAKGFLKVEGLGQARSREWVEIYPMETSFDLGAFTLEKIR